MASIPQILPRKWPGAQWTISDDDYSSLVWMGEGEKPTEATIRAYSDEVDTLIYREGLVATPRQFRLALDAAGLLDACEAVVAAAPRSVQISWEYAIMMERTSPLIDAFAASVGKTAEEVDAIFEAALAI